MIIGVLLKMENKEAKQMVKLDHDSEKMVQQSVVFDPNENWVHLEHDGNEISLSLENWNKLQQLANKVTQTLPDL